MSINPYILLGIGSLFAFFYAAVIIFGWAHTRTLRRIKQQAEGLSEVKVLNLRNPVFTTSETIKTVSLLNNIFKDGEGNRIDITKFDPFIASGASPLFPKAKDGNLLFFEKGTRNLKYIFEVPNLKNYR